MDVALNGSGSRVIEAFAQQNVGVKKKLQFLRKMKGRYFQLAVHPFGSRVLEKCWAVVRHWNG